MQTVEYPGMLQSSSHNLVYAPVVYLTFSDIFSHSVLPHPAKSFHHIPPRGIGCTSQPQRQGFSFPSLIFMIVLLDFRKLRNWYAELDPQLVPANHLSQFIGKTQYM